MKTTTLPEMTQDELHTILAGLDELPAKMSRVLHRKITEHVEQVIREFREREERIAANVKAAMEKRAAENSQTPINDLHGN